MTFSIIGTGNIAWFFGSRLLSGKHYCTGVYARDVDAAKELAGKLVADKHGSLSDVMDDDTDICFLAVSDIAISKVAVNLSFKQTVLIHTAGAVGLDTIKDAAKERAVLWPIYSISKQNLPTHRNIPCAWEATPGKAERYVKSVGHAITDELFEAKYAQRKWLHLSAVIGNNFINHLMAICEQICIENELPFSTLLPIITQTFDRLKQASPNSVQTGPAVRRDTTTIQQQMHLLDKHPHWQKVYEAITESIQSDEMRKLRG